MTLKSIYHSVQSKPRNLTAEELEVVLKEADWQHAFDLCILCPEPQRELVKRMAELAPNLR